MKPSTLLLVFFGVMLVSLLVGAFGNPLALEDPQGMVEWLRGHGSWAWLAAIVLVCADLVMPVPATSVIAALGMIYGFVLGAVIGAAALMSAGLLAYGLVRVLGRPMAVYLSGGDDKLQSLEAFFEQNGAWAVVLTRGLPMMPEVLSCLAGLARMGLSRFALALAIGSVPIGTVFSAIGVGWSDQPLLALAVAYVLPVLILPVAWRFLRADPKRAGST